MHEEEQDQDPSMWKNKTSIGTHEFYADFSRRKSTDFLEPEESDKDCIILPEGHQYLCSDKITQSNIEDERGEKNRASRIILLADQ